MRCAGDSSCRRPSPRKCGCVSGNGAHLLYRIDLPADDGGIVQRCLEALAAAYDDDAVKVDRTVFNPARVVKLYGTRARKGDNMSERPHRQAGIIKAPEPLQLVSIELLERLATDASETQVTSMMRPVAVHNHAINANPDTLRRYLESHGVPVKAIKPRNTGGHLLVLDGCPMNADHGRAGS